MWREQEDYKELIPVDDGWSCRECSHSGAQQQNFTWTFYAAVRKSPPIPKVCRGKQFYESGSRLHKNLGDSAKMERDRFSFNLHVITQQDQPSVM